MQNIPSDVVSQIQDYGSLQDKQSLQDTVPVNVGVLLDELSDVVSSVELGKYLVSIKHYLQLEKEVKETDAYKYLSTLGLGITIEAFKIDGESEWTHVNVEGNHTEYKDKLHQILNPEDTYVLESGIEGYTRDSVEKFNRDLECAMKVLKFKQMIHIQ